MASDGCGLSLLLLLVVLFSVGFCWLLCLFGLFLSIGLISLLVFGVWRCCSWRGLFIFGFFVYVTAGVLCSPCAPSVRRGRVIAHWAVFSSTFLGVRYLSGRRLGGWRFLGWCFVSPVAAFWFVWFSFFAALCLVWRRTSRCFFFCFRSRDLVFLLVGSLPRILLSAMCLFVFSFSCRLAPGVVLVCQSVVLGCLLVGPFPAPMPRSALSSALFPVFCFLCSVLS